MRYFFNRPVAVLLFGASLLTAAYGLNDQEIAEKTGAFIDGLKARGGFTGAVLIARDGAPFYRQAYGLANRSFDVPNRIDTKFNLGSMNKMFTATAIMQLVEKGKIALDGKLIDYVPDYPNRDIANRVTIRQLLTHTSGLGHYFTPEYMRTSKDLFRQVKDYIPFFADDSLLFEPGSRYSYSNAGFMVLGLVIEKVTGENYFDYVREHVYGPAGMTDTDAYENDYAVPNLAVGYTEMGAEPGRVKNNLFLHVCKGGPAGGGYSTVDDLLAFGNALMGNKLLSLKGTKEMTAGKVKAGTNSLYAYGFVDRVENGHHIIGHTGGFPGISGYLGIIPDLGYTVCVLSNFDGGSSDLSTFIEDLLVGETQVTRNRKLTRMVLDEAIAKGDDAAMALYEKNKKTGVMEEQAVNSRGYALLAQGKVKEAIAVFRVNVRLHPGSSNVYDSLAEAYMNAGETALAIENYEKSLSLNPANKNAVEKLEQLREK